MDTELLQLKLKFNCLEKRFSKWRRLSKYDHLEIFSMKSRLLDLFCFLYKLGLSDQYPQPPLHEGKSINYPGSEPSAFGIAIDCFNYTYHLGLGRQA
jgi:hypothetical protein